MKKVDQSHLMQKRNEFLLALESGKQIFETLMNENNVLKSEIEKMKVQEKLITDAEDDKFSPKNKIHVLEQQVLELQSRNLDLEKENIEFAKRYVEVEEQNNNLANLYVASFQLHSTLDMKEVVRIVMEIVINLIGGEIFALYFTDDDMKNLSLVSCEGPTETIPETIPLGEGIIGGAAEQGENYYISNISEKGAEEPLVVIPLKITDHLIGVLVVYKLLEQKNDFSEIDHELFSLLAGHAATALFSARLYQESERKFSTLKNFLELLKNN